MSSDPDFDRAQDLHDERQDPTWDEEEYPYWDEDKQYPLPHEYQFQEEIG